MFFFLTGRSTHEDPVIYIAKKKILCHLVEYRVAGNILLTVYWEQLLGLTENYNLVGTDLSEDQR